MGYRVAKRIDWNVSEGKWKGYVRPTKERMEYPKFYISPDASIGKHFLSDARSHAVLLSNATFSECRKFAEGVEGVKVRQV